MPNLTPDALAWLATHHGTISLAALAASGVTIDQREELIRIGVLVRVLDGAYRFAGTELDELGRCAAVCTRRDLVVAGPTAARLDGLRRSPRDGLIHVLAPPHSQPCVASWVRPYRTPMIFDDEVYERPDGTRLTKPKRTVVDLTRHLRDDALGSVIEDVLAKRYCVVDDMFATAERLNTPGRPWVRRFIRVLGSRRAGAPAESEPELRVYNALIARGVRSLVRQHRIVLPEYGSARFDMAIPELRWALEVDVHPEHRTIEGVANDNRRDDAAERIDWAVRRVSEAELDRFEHAIDAIVAAIERHRRRMR